MRRRLRLDEPRGPWKAKGAPARTGIMVYVCARCRRQGTLLKCGSLYGCKNCVEKVGGPEAFVRAFTERAQTARQEIEDTLAQAAS